MAFAKILINNKIIKLIKCGKIIIWYISYDKTYHGIWYTNLIKQIKEIIHVQMRFSN